MDDLNGQSLWAKPILSPHTHTCQVQPSQSHSFLLSGAKATQAGHSTWQDKDALTKTGLPQNSMTWEGHRLHTTTHSLQALVLTYPEFHCLMAGGFTQGDPALKQIPFP